MKSPLHSAVMSSLYGLYSLTILDIAVVVFYLFYFIQLVFTYSFIHLLHKLEDILNSDTPLELFLFLSPMILFQQLFFKLCPIRIVYCQNIKNAVYPYIYLMRVSYIIRLFFIIMYNASYFNYISYFYENEIDIVV